MVEQRWEPGRQSHCGEFSKIVLELSHGWYGLITMATTSTSVHKGVAQLIATLRNFAASIEERELALFNANSLLFDAGHDAQICFIMNKDQSAAGIAAFSGPHGLDGLRKLPMLLMHMSDLMAFSSPVDDNSRRIEVFKNRGGRTGLYDDRETLARQLNVTFTMRLPR